MMNRFLLPVAAVAICFSANAQDLPQTSPKGEVEQVIGLTNVQVDYHRPSVKERQIFGGLLPYDKLWRLGANQNTTIEIDGPVIVEGKQLDKGKYSMFAIPGKEVWTIIFNKNTELWGEDDYKESEDALRVKVKPVSSEFTETLLFSFDEVKNDKARMDIRWEKTRVSLNLFADATQQAMENIKKAMSEPDIKAGTYASSARYAIEHNVMLKQALEWATIAVKMDPKFYNVYTLALAQAANGQKKEAISTAERSIKLSHEAGNDAYVKMNQDKIKEWSSASK